MSRINRRAPFPAGMPPEVRQAEHDKQVLIDTLNAHKRAGVEIAGFVPVKLTPKQIDMLVRAVRAVES